MDIFSRERTRSFWRGRSVIGKQSASPEAGGVPHLVLGLTARLALVAMAVAAPASAQDAALAAGKAVWQSAGCDGCHGNNGQGGTSPDLPNGPSLHATKLDRDGLVQVIACGRLGTQMPAWLKGAYTATACNGASIGPAPQGTVVVGALSSADISALVDFLLATFVGK